MRGFGQLLVSLSLLLLLALAPVGAQTELKAAVGLALPPYVIQETGKGLEVDIVRQALELAGYKMRLDYVPFARLAVSMANKSSDLALTINESSGVKNVSYSDSHITYQNVAVSLKSKNLKIAAPGDLKAYSVVAFQQAPDYLGPDFAAMAKTNPKYSEIADQLSQVKLLFSGRAEVLVMDVNIFKYFRQQITDLDTRAEVAIHEIFPPTAYKVAFASKEIADKFNVALRRLRDNGSYAAIFKSYIK